MSDAFLRYVPNDPTYVPRLDQIDQATTLLASLLPLAERVTSRVEPETVFVDAGVNWDGVRCPVCEADAESWWAAAMSRAAEAHFKNLHLKAPCCGADVALNALKYGWPVAFGRFVLEAMNPNTGGLSELALRQLADALGSPVLQVQAHV